MLWGLVEPRLFVRMSRTPAHSSTARTGPPAITPVPVAAGFNSTPPAPPRAAPPATTAPPPAPTPPTPAPSTTSTSTSTPTPAAARRFLNYRFAAGVRRFGFFALAGAPRRRDRRRRVTLLIGRHQ